MQYIGYHFTLDQLVPYRDLMMATLGERGFESFIATDTGFSAYVQEENDTPAIADDLIVFNPEIKYSYTREVVAPTNWNAEWEKNFDPIYIDEKCYVRATFHDPMPGAQYEILIDPKMSFGTGHHQTTSLMVRHLIELELAGKKTLDMGCGTAVLAILAAMRGATPIEAIDIDDWCVENSIENCERNGYPEIKVEQGTAPTIDGRSYEVLIANINRNILLQDMPAFAKALLNKGTLLLSGFYTDDLEIIKDSCKKNGLTYVTHYVKDNWVAARFEMC